MGFIQKIYKSLDFTGNRIKNLRVDTPEETINSEDIGNQHYNEIKEFVANKEYVDKISSYDSPLVKMFGKSLVFDWVTNINNKSIKEVLEILLFPRIKPKYIDATVDSVNVIINENKTPKRKNKYLVFDDAQRTLTNHYYIEIQLNPNDRVSTKAGQLLIYNADNSEVVGTITATDTNETIQKFEFDFRLNASNKIFFERIYTEAKSIKKDTRGDDSQIENPNWVLKTDITKDIHSNISFETCYLFSGFVESLTDEVTPTGNLSKHNFILIPANTKCIIDVAIPIKNLKGELRAAYYDKSNNLKYSESIYAFELKNSITVDDIEYNLNRYYLGYFEKETKLYFIRHE
jgi:hypothetical protein